MLSRIDVLIRMEQDFAIETTLATRSYVDLIRSARNTGYKIKLVYFWLRSPQEAIVRVATRVSKGGHHIPDDVIQRRYYRGIYNLFKLYIKVCDNWLLVNNTQTIPELVCEGEFNLSITIFNDDIWEIIKNQSDVNKT